MAWFLGLLLWVPRVESVFQRLNVKLPSSAELVIASTHGGVPLALLLAAAFIILDLCVSSRLHRAGAKAMWSSLMTLAPIAAITLTALALSRPMLLVLEALSR
jgi:type II secretory pathway component PulF